MHVALQQILEMAAPAGLDFQISLPVTAAAKGPLGKVCRALADFTGLTLSRRLGFEPGIKTELIIRERG
jgi:hypothetical protein